MKFVFSKIIALIGKINSLSTLFSIYKEYVDQAFTIVLLLIIMLFSIVISMLLPQLIAGMGSTKEGWTTMALIFAIPCAIIGMFRFIFVKEVVDDNQPSDQQKEEVQKIPLKQSLKCVFSNK